MLQVQPQKKQGGNALKEISYILSFSFLFFDPAGMGDTLATLDDTDLFGVRGEPPGTLGEASYVKTGKRGVPIVAPWLLNPTRNHEVAG